MAGSKFSSAARVLHGLKGHAAHAGLFEGIVDDLADLVVVEPFLQSDDESRGDIVARSAFRGPLRARGEVPAAQICSSGSRSKESNCR